MFAYKDQWDQGHSNMILKQYAEAAKLKKKLIEAQWMIILHYTDQFDSVFI